MSILSSLAETKIFFMYTEVKIFSEILQPLKIIIYVRCPSLIL